MKKLIIYLAPLLLWSATKAQVLFSEDFDSYPSGDLISDLSSTIPDQGGWLSGSSSPQTANLIVTPETGKGNVIVAISNGTSPIGVVNFRQAYGTIDALWNNRTAGNNIMKFEYEFYGSDNFNIHGQIESQGSTLINVTPQSYLNRIAANYWDTTSNKNIILKNYNTTIFPYDTWLTVEIFIDYNTNDVYFYLPTLNLQATGTFSHNRIPDGISFYIGALNQSSVVKLDNIKLSALQTLPSYLVSTSEFVSSKFTIFPNPVTDVVTITNSEDVGIVQIELFDSNGKKVKTQEFANESQVQLDLSSVASGIYQMYIKTIAGIAVEKVVKK